MEEYDLPIDFIVTPEEVIETNTPYPKPQGIDWERLDTAASKRCPYCSNFAFYSGTG